MDGQPTTLRMAGLELESVVDGPGIRATVFVQGCSHHCEGCHNPTTHDPAGGEEWTIEAVADKVTANPLIRGITLSGGEPMEQAEAVDRLVDLVHARCPRFDFMLYTGYTWEWLLEKGSEAQKRLLSKMMILVDGPFILAKRNLELRFRGSENQRVIDVQRSLREGRPVLWEFETYFGLQ